MRTLKTLTILFLSAVCSVAVYATDYQASDFGIKADGRTLNSANIQAAVDYISTHGGGRLIFTPGNYVTGTVYLKSDVTLHLEAGATILGSYNPWDYIKDPYIQWASMIYALRQKNVGITGEGTINGRGFVTANNFVDYINRGIYEDAMKLDRPYEANRPQNLFFRECDSVTVTGITLRDPASWNQTYERCTNVYVEGLTVDSKSYWNNDGIDIIDCKDVIIRNCYIDAADDVFCFKSHSHDHICENVLIENCVGRSSANGVKFGTVSKGGFKNFVIRNITMFDTFRSAVTFAAVDGAEIENILVDGIRSLHTGNVIFLRMGERWSTVTTKHADGTVTKHRKQPYMKNVVIRNVYAEVPLDKPDAGYNYEGPVEDLPRNISPGIIIAGIPQYKMEGIVLENIEIVVPGGSNPLYAFRGSDPESLDSIPEMISYYPEFSQWKELPAWGAYLRHAKDVSFKNVIFRAEQKEYRPAIVADDIDGLSIENVSYVEPNSEGKSQVVTYKTIVKQ